MRRLHACMRAGAAEGRGARALLRGAEPLGGLRAGLPVRAPEPEPGGRARARAGREALRQTQCRCACVAFVLSAVCLQRAALIHLTCPQQIDGMPDAAAYVQVLHMWCRQIWAVHVE